MNDPVGGTAVSARNRSGSPPRTAWEPTSERLRIYSSWPAGEFVVMSAGIIAHCPEVSEHVAFAGGGDVWAAREISIAWAAPAWGRAGSHQSVDRLLPGSDCWPAVAKARDRASVGHSDGSLQPVLFRLCPQCQERNVVRE